MLGAVGWSWATLKPMSKLHHRTKRILRVAIGAAVLVLPSTALADCSTVVAKAAFKGAIAEYYPQACYSAVNTDSPNVARNLKSAMRRDRTRKVKTTIQWLPKNKVRVTSNYKLKSSIQLRKGAKILTKGSISAKAAVLKLKKTNGKLTTALIWTLGKKKITLTTPATLAKVVKKKK